MTSPKIRNGHVVPRLAYMHPGYFKVVVALILTHVGLGIDALFVPPGSKGFAVMERLLGNNLYPLSAAHWITALMLIVGLYAANQFWLVRLGSAVSAVVFNFMAAGFVAAAMTYHTSFFGAITCVALSLSSVAAAKEPEEGPRGAT